MKSQITNLENLDVWKTKSDFNYDVWAENTTIKLCNVNWDESQNVVEFDSVESRRQYFDSLDGYVISRENLLNTLNQVINSQTAKVEIPFSELNFNYLAVYGGEIPVTTGQPARRDTFYFISDATQTAPSVTQLTLTPDVWTTYQFDVTIDRGHYRRGHYMVNDVTVDELFTDDFDRLSANLNTLPEPITINTRKVGQSKIVPLYGDNAYLCIMTYADVYSDTWQNEDGTKSIPYLPKYTRNGGIVDGFNTIAIKRDEMQTFMDNVPKQFWKAVRGAFYADEKWLFWISDPVTKWGVTIRNIGNTNAFSKIIESVKFTKDDFGFDSKYAKTYTSQFTPIDVMKGSEYIGSIGIENFNDINVGISSNVIYPFVKIEALLSGINANGNGSFVWQRLDIDQGTTLENGDWRNTLFDLNIPVFAISENPRDNWEYEHSADIAKQHSNREIDYRIAVRNAETARDNGNASATTSRDNSLASAETAQTIGNRSASTSQTNGLASAETSRTNSTNSATTSHDNTSRSLQTNQTIANRNNAFTHEQTSLGIEFDNNVKDTQQQYHNMQINNQKNYLQSDYDFNSGAYAAELAAGMGARALQHVSTDVNSNVDREAQVVASNDTETPKPQQADTDTTATVSSSDGGSYAGSSTPGGDTVAFAAWATQMVTQSGLAIARLGHDKTLGDTKLQDAQNVYNQQTNALQTLTTDFNNEQNDNNRDNTASNISDTYNTGTSNNDDSFTTATGNINRSYSTDTANINRSYNTSVSNNADSYNTSVANTNRSYDTTKANITRSYNTAMANAEDNYNRVDTNINFDREASAVGDILERGNNGGDHFQYSVGRLVYQFVIRKPDSKSLNNIESMFDNYGYSWDEYVGEITEYVDTDKFNYWQMDDILFKPTNVKQIYLNKIRDMFKNGVRIWKVEAIS